MLDHSFTTSSLKAVNGNDLCHADIISTPLGFAVTQYFLLLCPPEQCYFFPSYAKPFPPSEHLSFPSAEGRFTLRSCHPPSPDQTSLLLNPKLHMEKRREWQYPIGVSQGQLRFFFVFVFFNFIGAKHPNRVAMK